MEIRLLGPVELWSQDSSIDVDVRRGRLVLAILALEVNRLIPVRRLIELAWPDPSPAARAALHVHVSRIRSALRRAESRTSGGATVIHSGAGYLLRADPDHVDAHRFRVLVGRARLTGRDEERVALLDQALDLWRGPALTDVCPEDVRIRLGQSLEEIRFAAVEDRIDALLRLGRYREVIEDLSGLVAEHPYRQRFTGQLMLALHGDGRTYEALAAYQRTVRRLADLGLYVGPELRRIETTILRDDPECLARISQGK